MTTPALRIRASVTCPVHRDRELIPVGGGARGICPADGATHQMDTPEVVMTTAGPAYACCGCMSSSPGKCPRCGQQMQPVTRQVTTQVAA